MRPFEPVDLGHDYWLDRDERQWVLRTVRLDKHGNPAMDPRLKSFGGMRTQVVGYYPSLPALLRALGERRLRFVHVEDWHLVVADMDAIQAKLARHLARAWEISSD